MSYLLLIVGVSVVLWGLSTLILAGCEYARRRRRGDWTRRPAKSGGRRG